MVSLVIPVYQVTGYIERCIRSVMMQSYVDIECIIVDDATNDDSIIKCENMISEYDGQIIFKIIHHESNKGLSIARNTGTSAACGKYIFYLDSDDEIPPKCIETLVQLAEENPLADMVIGSHQRIYTDGRSIPVSSDLNEGLYNHNESYDSFLKHKLPEYAWNNLIKRSFLIQNLISFHEGILYEDKLWMFYLMKALNYMYVSKTITYHYCIRPNSLLTSMNREYEGESLFVVFSEILANLTPGCETSELNRYVGGFCSNYIEFNRTIPQYRELMKSYICVSWNYQSIVPLMKLYSTKLLSVVPYGVSIMKRLSTLLNGR